MASVQSYRDLRIWQQSIDLVERVRVTMNTLGKQILALRNSLSK